jgi:hypothetical protein
VAKALEQAKQEESDHTESEPEEEEDESEILQEKSPAKKASGKAAQTQNTKRTIKKIVGIKEPKKVVKKDESMMEEDDIEVEI